VPDFKASLSPSLSHIWKVKTKGEKKITIMKQPKLNELAPHIPDNGPFCIISRAVIC